MLSAAACSRIARIPSTVSLSAFRTAASSSRELSSRTSFTLSRVSRLFKTCR